jgi:hypothetical protein
MDQPSVEEWRIVPGHEQTYEVSSLGRIRSVPRPRTKGGLLKLKTGKRGYLSVCFVTNGRQETHEVHRVVAAAFLGQRPDGHEVRHLDGNRIDCRVANLAYGTRSENQRDKRLHGTDHNVAKTHCPQGHPYDELNTRMREGRRYCRTCDGWTGHPDYRQEWKP